MSRNDPQFVSHDSLTTAVGCALTLRARVTACHALVLTEALEYIYRYQRANKTIVIKPVVLFSSPISNNNDWFVIFLERYVVEVFYLDSILGLVSETRSFHPRALSWFNRAANPKRVEVYAD